MTAPPGGGTDRMDLDRFIPALITFLANRVISTGSSTYRRAFGIGIMEFRVLAMLAAEPNIKASRIVEVVGSDKALVSRSLRVLLDDGLVLADPPTGQPRFTLSAPGRAMYDEALAISREREGLLLHGFDEADREQLIAFLRRLLNNTAALKALADRQGS